MCKSQHCHSIDCDCTGLSRRDFVRVMGLGMAAAWAAGPTLAMAGPFDGTDFEKLVPADKKLRPEWVKSLFDRGTPTWYGDGQLEFIGMPVGGICAGQVYLGGDGKLWNWDIFNQHIGTGAGHYANPPKQAAPLAQGFAIRTTVGGKSGSRTLDRAGFSKIRFRGEYPIGLVEYSDPQSPVAVSLEAFSPFVPLSVEESDLPCTVMRFTVKNTGKEAAQVELTGWLENAICRYSGDIVKGIRRNRLRRQGKLMLLECSAEPETTPSVPARSDIVFEDFEKPTYEGWTVAGTAFGDGPTEKAKIPNYQGDVGGEGKRVVNSHNIRGGGEVAAGDAHKGRLTSREFRIERRFINFHIGGGNHRGQTCLNLLVDGKVVRSATGRGDNRMQRESLDVRQWDGKTARIEIVDDKAGAWGNIGVDHIVFSDSPALSGPIDKQPDYGTMALTLLDATEADSATMALPAGNPADDVFSDAAAAAADVARPFGQKLVGAITRKLTIAPEQSATVTFLITWHFANLKLRASARDSGRFYATRFASASAVASHVAEKFDALYAQTRLWRDTWYDSTLPYWFLDRAFANTSILASSTCHRFQSGRFYGWEGVGCCEGTCTHVWHYAHAVARLFPQLERDLRERTDFGLAFDPNTGVAKFRGEAAGLAVDGQSGSILRAYREHLMSADAAFLKRTWPNIKKAMQCLIDKDANGDGIIEGGQHNTLDADWYGPVAWLSGLYLAALRASEEMAREMNDADFAAKCRGIFDTGRKRIVETLFDKEYFINKPDPAHANAINSGTGCEIDQVFGQSWAFQVALGRVLPENETRTALKSLWRYNFTPDVGPYRQANKPGRWYAMPGEAGLLMCTFPRNDWNYKKAAGKGPDWAAGYFNECMNGFEYQAAGHMIWEGMVQEGLAVTRAVHDRYGAERRNPWNEVECGDHYARSMASYGVYLAACGFEYNGPKGHMGFAPRLTPENFKAAFTSAEGWGTFSQKSEGGKQTATIEVKWGQLRLKTLALSGGNGAVRVTLAGKAVESTAKAEDGRVMITLGQEVLVKAGEKIEFAVG